MPSYNSIQHVFFDLDRTLWDFQTNSRDAMFDVYEINELNKLGIPDAATFFDVYIVHNEHCWALYRQNKMRKDHLRHQRFHLALQEFGITDRPLAKKLGKDYVRISPFKTALMPGTREILEYLYPKYPMHIITNGFQEVQFIKLEQCGIDKYFDQIITSERVGRRKPDPKIFHFALSRAKATAEESIMIGDDYEIDVKGAEGVGMKGVLFSQESPAEPTAQVINDLATIREML